MMSNIEITDEMVDAYCRHLFGDAIIEVDPQALASFRGHVRNGITAVAPLIAAAEREACARALEQLSLPGSITATAHDARRVFAAAVRARSS